MNFTFSALKERLGAIDELCQDVELLYAYNDFIINDLAAIEPIDFGFIVSEKYIFDFLITYYSIIKSWTFYPVRLNVFALDDATFKMVNFFQLDKVVVHDFRHLVEEDNWNKNVALKIKLIEHSGLEKCIVSDVDNVFLAEIPEMHFLLNSNEFVFICSPIKQWLLQPSLWAFKKNVDSVNFSKLWYNYSLGRTFSEASGLPFAICDAKSNNKLPNIRVLGIPKSKEAPFFRTPYNTQANIKPFQLNKGEIGFSEQSAGNAKVLHLGALRARGNESVEARMEILKDEYEECEAIFPYYESLAILAHSKITSYTCGI